MVRMQGPGMAGERRPVYPAWIHWNGGDNGLMCGSNETPRTGRGVGVDGRVIVNKSIGSGWVNWFNYNGRGIYPLAAVQGGTR